MQPKSLGFQGPVLESLEIKYKSNIITCIFSEKDYSFLKFGKDLCHENVELVILNCFTDY